MDIKTLFLAIGLLILIIVNIVLGTLTAVFDGEFDWKRFWRGCLKGAVVLLCFAATYLAGYLNRDIAAVSINGADVDVLTAVILIVLAGYYYYAKQVIAKLGALVKSNVTVTSKAEISNSDT